MPNLFDTLLERLEGSRYTGYFSCLCPFHDDHNPSFFVYEESSNPNWEFRCASCGKHGSLKYLDKVTGSHFIPQRDTVSKVLPQWRKWEEKYDDLEGIVHVAHRNLTRYPKFQEYFKKRKIYEYVDEGSLGYLDGWCLFPVYSAQHRILDIVVRSSSSNNTRYVVRPSTDIRPLFVPSWKEVNESKTIFVVFGIIDSISLHLAGLPSVTGVTGKSLSPDLLKPLNKRFIIIPDAGEETEAYKLANKLGWRAKVKELKYEDGCKDPDDVRRMFGNDYLIGALA